MILDLGLKLCLRNWENALSTGPYTPEGWSRQILDSGLTIDLSKIEWVEPGAAVRAVLLAEGILLDDAGAVTVRLPLAGPAEEENWLLEAAGRPGASGEIQRRARDASRAIERRRQAARVLDRLQFREALQHPHLERSGRKVEFVLIHDWSAVPRPGATSSQQSSAGGTLGTRPSSAVPTPAEDPDPADLWYFDLPLIYPLTWVSDPAKEQGDACLRELAATELRQLARVLWHGSGRVQGCDSRYLAYVFAQELVANAVEHAGREYALLTAWARPKGIELREHEILECEKGFAAWCKDYPLIELTAGDSGRGLPATLRASWEKQGRPTTLRIPLGKREESDHIVVWGFDKWSTSFQTASRQGPKRGTRGLYRVRRAVRKYLGLVTLRAETSYAGYDFGDPGSPGAISESLFGRELARSPGTVVHARIPVMPVDAALRRRADRPLPQSDVVPEFEDCDFSRWKGELSTVESGVAEIVRAKSRRLRGSLFGCVIADFGFRPLAREVLEETLRSLTLVSHPVLVVVSNAVVAEGPDVLDGIVEAVERSHLDTDAHVASVGDLVLLRRPEGSYAWVGGPRASSEDGAGSDVVDLLLSKGRARLAEPQTGNGRRRRRNQDALVRRLAGCDHALRLGPGRIELAFSLRAVDEHLSQLDAHREKQAATDLTTAIARFSETHFGTPRQLLRTPSLELVSQFAPFGQLFAELEDSDSGGNLMSQVAFALARLSRARLGFLGPTSSQARLTAERVQVVDVVADARVPSDLLRSYAECLERMLRGIDVVPIRLGPGDKGRFDEDGSIILLADVVQSESTVKRLLSQMVRARRLPDAIVAAVDARARRGTPLQYMKNRSIKVVSLCELDAIRGQMPAAGTPDSKQNPGSRRRIVNISPEDLQPERDEDASQPCAVDSSQLLNWVEKQKALYFGHVSQPDGRHFCTYLDMNRLLGTPGKESTLGSVGREILEEFKEAIDGWAGGRSVDVICYPAGDRPLAAEMIARELAVHYTSTRHLAPQPIHFNWSPDDLPQVHNYDMGLFPGYDQAGHVSRVSFDRVVIVDWGSISGQRVHRVLRQVAVHAREVLIVVFASQGRLAEEQSLTHLQSIGGASVAVRFLCRLRTPAFDGANCPYCQQLERLDAEERFYPTDLFRHYVSRVRARLTPWSVEKIRNRRPEEWPPLRAEEIMSVIAQRELVEQAQQSTGHRQRLWNSLCDMTGASLQGREPEGSDPESNPPRGRHRERTALFLLLAAEWTLLKRPPLNLPKFKSLLAMAAAEIIGDPASSTDECANAIAVLRTASKTEFAQRLPGLFRQLLERDTTGSDLGHSLLYQLLYCAFTYLQRDYQVSATLDYLVESLQKCSRAEWVQGVVRIPEVDLIVHALYHYALYQQRRLELHDRNALTAFGAWRELHRGVIPKYTDPHHFSAVLSNLSLHRRENTLRNAPSNIWQEHLTAWREASAIVAREVLPFLGGLKDVFLGLGSGVDAGSIRLLTIAAQDVATTIARFTQILEGFATRSRDPQDGATWLSFVRLRTELWDLVFDPTEGALIRLLRDCPADIHQSLQRVCADPANCAGLGVDMASLPGGRVFCHGSLVEWCLAEILRNVRRHNIPKGNGLIPVSVTTERRDNRLSLIIRNGGHKVKVDSGKRGLHSCLTRLRPYDADLSHAPIMRGSFSYETRLEFREWVD